MSVSIKSPEIYYPGRVPVTIFVAGGITNCPDWQVFIEEEMNKRPFNREVILFNPRRDDFDVSDPSMTEDQISWEKDHLERADIILFWFPKETLCPITLFELGKYLVSDKKLFIGCHPDYKRKTDVEYQVKLVQDVEIHDNLIDLATDLSGYIINDLGR